MWCNEWCNRKNQTKKLLIGISVILIILAIVCINRTDAEDTTPANTAFDDYNFYKVVIDAYNENHSHVDYNHNLTDNELQSITVINYDKTNLSVTAKIRSVKGIEKLTNLESLVLNDTYIKTIDLSQNRKLVTLALKNGELTSINLSNNQKLKQLNLLFNQIESIDLSPCELLEDLTLMGNNLEEIDVKANKNLKSLSIGRNFSPENGEKIL